MKQKLLVVALAGAFAAPAAQADVVIAGTISPGFTYTDQGAGKAVTSPTGDAVAATADTTALEPANASSRFSITSTEDMGNGMTGGAFVDIRGSGGGFNNYNNLDSSGLAAFRYGASIGAGWGKLEFGRNFSPYTWTMINNDPHQGAIYFGPFAVMGQAGGQGLWLQGDAAAAHAFFRTGTGAHYFSPDWNGLSFKASYMAEAVGAVNGQIQAAPGQSAKQVSEIGLSADWAPADKPFYLGAAYQTRKNANGANAMAGPWGAGSNLASASGSTDSVLLGGGGVKFGDLKVGLWVEQAQWKTDGVTAGISDIKRTAFWVPVSYTLPTGTLGAAFIMAQNLSGTNVAGTAGFNGDDTGATVIQLSYIHNLSKQTQLILMGQNVSGADKAAYGGNGLGANQMTIYAGLQHTF